MNEKENEKVFENVFRFTLTQGDVLLCEKMFDADDFNPFTRYSIDIRDILPRAITRLQKTLSKRSYDVVAEVGKDELGEPVSHNLLKLNQSLVNSYPQRYRNSMRYNPRVVVQQVEDRSRGEVELKTIRGVECKIGLYINDNPIVERVFYVDGYNPVAKQSTDLIYVVTDIAENIASKIKRNDIKNMWDDYDLINMRGLTINQIRELPIGKREYLIRQLRR